jgi:hypothetical protein
MSLTTVHRRIAQLERQMREAAEAMEFETAAGLRNEIARLRGEPTASTAEDDGSVVATVSQPPPGAMGLGTHLPVAAPPKTWRKPKKPDPMTAHTRPRKGR